MTSNEIRRELESLTRKRSLLPSGSIVRKSNKAKTKYYYYNRVYTNGIPKDVYIPYNEVDTLRAGIEEGRALDRKISALEKKLPPSSSSSCSFYSDVITGETLERFASSTSAFKKRYGITNITTFLSEPSWGRVFVLFGLRRTGKTTLLSQALSELSEAEREKAAYIKASGRISLSDINQDLMKLEKEGYRYLFVDEVTKLEDFIGGASLFSDIYAASGIKLVLSGTDSLGFLLSEDEELFDRTITLHTTFIPYREFEEVLGISSVDEYIRYGGTMCAGGTHYNTKPTFDTIERTDAYVNSAIAVNIQNSLKFYQYGSHFRSLHELYDKNELTSAINRVVEDMNHRFTVEVLTRDFKSSDYAISDANLIRDRSGGTDILRKLDVKKITTEMKDLLEIKNRDEQKVEITEGIAAEIEEYLRMLDLVYYIDVVSAVNPERKRKRTVISQPGLRYAQAEALIKSVMDDAVFMSLAPQDRDYVTSRILSEITGRMLEDMVLLESHLSYPEKKVFTLQFAAGEFDMVIYDPKTLSCRIFEIKHSNRTSPGQYVHLVNEEKCALTEHLYGKITEKTVLYRGKTTVIDNISYVNVESYLRSLPSSPLVTY